MKRCSKCKEEKSKECFRFIKRVLHPSLNYCCKECEKKTRKRSELSDQTKRKMYEWEKKQRDSLSDWWIKKSILIKSKGTIKTNQIMPEMIRAKRERLLEWRFKKENGLLKKDSIVKGPYKCKCIVCEIDFLGAFRRNNVCSKECERIKQLKRMRNKWWEGKDSRESFECKECGKVVIPKYENGNGMRTDFCSTKCGKSYSKRERGGTHKRRAEFFGCEYENVNPLKVFMRDGWRCQLCQRKLKSKDRGSFKDSAPELDHIIPLSKGGAHSYQNTQCVCRKCNSEKGSIKRGQLRMFG